MLDYTKTNLHFKIIEEIGGEGKNSTVHIAHDYQLDANIVVKKIDKTCFTDQTTYFNESKILYLSSHPNIVPIQYSCADDNYIYITMPIYSGGSLNKLIDSRFLTLSEIIRYSINFLSGLHFIHTKNLIHCDIKPSNILLSDSNDALLSDFGLSRYLDFSGLTSFDKVYQFHRAPETIISDKISHQSDIYQAGLTIYRICNGNTIFKQQLNKYVKDGKFDENKYNDAISKGKFPDRGYYIPHIPQKLRNYIRKSLEVNVVDRYDSVLELLNDLASIDISHNWQYIPNTDISIWNCHKDDKEYKVELFNVDSDKCTIQTSKKKVCGVDFRNINEYCKKGINFEEGYGLIKKVLNNNSL